MDGKKMWLVAEYCGHDIYMGWHLYLRENPGYQRRNKDGDWGWCRYDVKSSKAGKLLKELGCEITGDGTMDKPADGIAKFAKLYPLPGRRVWGKRRGGVRVVEGEWGELKLLQLTGRKKTNNNRKGAPTSKSDDVEVVPTRKGN